MEDEEEELSALRKSSGYLKFEVQFGNRSEARVKRQAERSSFLFFSFSLLLLHLVASFLGLLESSAASSSAWPKNEEEEEEKEEKKTSLFLSSSLQRFLLNRCLPLGLRQLVLGFIMTIEMTMTKWTIEIRTSMI